MDDRIFSTSVDLSYTFSDIKLVAPQDEKKLEFQVPLKEGDEGFKGSVWDDSVAARARTATLEVFAVDESASVQVRNSRFSIMCDVYEDGCWLVGVGDAL